MDNVVFQDINVTHAEVLATLHAEGFNRPWTTADFLSFLGLPGMTGSLALCGETKPVGFGLWQTVTDQADLITIIVDPSARRQGLANALLFEMRSRLVAVGVSRICLEVASDNIAALNLYRKVGFQVIGTRPDYYPGPQGRVDAIMMELRLS